MKGTLIGSGRTAEIFEWGDGKIVKLYRPGFPPDEAEFEAQRSRIVAATGLPVPQVYETVEVDGQRGVVYERIDGESMLKLMQNQPRRMPTLVRQFADLHRQIHQQTASQLPLQRDYLHWAINDTDRLTSAQKSAILRQLDTLPNTVQLCHGDYHPDNVLVTPNRAVVIDWLVARQGNPLADVARTAIVLTTGSLQDVSLKDRIIIEVARRYLVRAYLNRYFEGQTKRRAEMQRWIPVMAAARLRELEDNETAALLRLVERGLNQ